MKKRLRKKQAIQKEVKPTSGISKFFKSMIIVSIAFSVIAVLASILALGNVIFMQAEDAALAELNNIQNDVVLDEADDADDEEDVIVINEVDRVSRIDFEAVQMILDNSPKPDFVQSEDGYDISVVDPVTGDSAIITADTGVGLRIYAVPDDYDGRIVVLYYGETEHAFEPMIIDLNNLNDLSPKEIDSYFPGYEPLNILSPNQRYLVSIIDSIWSGDIMNTINIKDLLGEYPGVMMNDKTDARITATSYDWVNYEVPEFDIKWTSDTCIEYSLYENHTPEPRPLLRTEQYCFPEIAR